MKNCNQKINCSVTDCCYNQSGMHCSKECISVCCSSEGCTKCASYVNKCCE